MSQAEKVFASIDLDGHGAILFDEFCDYAIKLNLDLDDDDDANTLEGVRIKTSQQVLDEERKKPKKKFEVPQVTAAQRNSELLDSKYTSVWEELSAKLPLKMTPEDKKRRENMFRAFDPNGNGYLSLAECDKAMISVLDCKILFENKKVVLRAFQAAKDVNPSGRNSVGDDFIDKKEFRIFLQYLRDYFELGVMFERMDNSGDGKIELHEFKWVLLN